jgi:hypothetical protein
MEAWSKLGSGNPRRVVAKATKEMKRKERIKP